MPQLVPHAALFPALNHEVPGPAGTGKGQPLNHSRVLDAGECLAASEYIVPESEDRLNRRIGCLRRGEGEGHHALRIQPGVD